MDDQPGAWTMTVLGGIAGAVDTLGFQVLGHVFISNMTGNTDRMGIAIVGHHGWEVLARGFAIAAFAAGVVLGTALAAAPVDQERPHAARTRLLIAELLLVAATAAMIGIVDASGASLHATDWRFYVIALLAASSMGAQNVSLVEVYRGGPLSTHLTGAITQLAQGVTRRALGAGGGRVAGHLGLCAGFLAGGIVTTLMFGWNPFAAAMTPLVGLAAVFLRRPRPGAA